MMGSADPEIYVRLTHAGMDEAEISEWIEETQPIRDWVNGYGVETGRLETALKLALA
jgi:hypothetical protein